MENTAIIKLLDDANGEAIEYNERTVQRFKWIDLGVESIKLRIEIISTNSRYRQGIMFKTKGSFEVDGRQISNAVVLWEDTAPNPTILAVSSKESRLLIYNVWETEHCPIDGMHNGAALFVEESGNSFVYHCNDGQPDDDFDDIVFKLSFVD